MKLALPDIARAMDASGAPAGEVSGYSIDSRTVAPGDLFFALRGENHDGHAFVSEVLAKGAAAAVVDQNIEGLQLIRVRETLTALQSLARWGRERWGGTVVGVTGSAGKTTTKDIIAAMLETQMKVGKTTGNFNNHIGLPVSILRIPDEARAAVLELGMNHAGEIRDLATIAQPQIGVVTNVGYAHIEAFESIEGIAAAKGELVESLSVDGVAVLNADDQRTRAMKSRHSGRTVLYGLSADADVRATDIELLETGVRFRVDGTLFESALAGRHGIRNILSGLAVSSLFGIEPTALRDTVRAFVPGKMRGERLQRNGITIINDCYNSNPDAARAMLDVLRDIPAQRHVAVLGEMLELGRWSETLHRDVGRYAARCGVNVLVGIRGVARSLIEAATEAGLAKNAAYFFDDPTEAGELLRSIVQPGDAILFKGSRGTRVEKALERLFE